MRMGIQAIEGSTWDIFFGRMTESTIVSLRDGFSFKSAPNDKATRIAAGPTKFVDCEFFEIPESDELRFRSGIKRWIASVERANGCADFVRFTPGTMTVKVEIFKGN